MQNRTYPDKDNNPMHKAEFRERLMDAVYLGFENDKKPEDNTDGSIKAS